MKAKEKEPKETVVTFVKLTRVQREELNTKVAALGKMSANGHGRASFATMSNVLRFALDLGLEQMRKLPMPAIYKSVSENGMRRGRRYAPAA